MTTHVPFFPGGPFFSSWLGESVRVIFLWLGVMSSEFRDTPQILPPSFLNKSVTGTGIFQSSGLNGRHPEEPSVATVTQTNGRFCFSGLGSVASCGDFCISLPLSYFPNPHNVRVPLFGLSLPPAVVWLSVPAPDTQSPFPNGKDPVSAEVSCTVRRLCFSAVTAVRSRITHPECPQWSFLEPDRL